MKTSTANMTKPPALSTVFQTPAYTDFYIKTNGRALSHTEEQKGQGQKSLIEQRKTADFTACREWLPR